MKRPDKEEYDYGNNLVGYHDALEKYIDYLEGKTHPTEEKDYCKLFTEKYNQPVIEGSVYPSLRYAEAVYSCGKWKKVGGKSCKCGSSLTDKEVFYGTCLSCDADV